MFATTLKRMEKKAIEKGIERGIEKGKILTAKRMFQDGLSLDAIAKYTELTIPQLNKLKNEK